MRFHMLVSPSALGLDDDDYSEYFFDETRLRFRCNAKMGVAGVEGDMGLWIPPSDYDIDAWEASRLAGEPDWWAFSKFMTVPSGSEGEPPTILVFKEWGNFFDDYFKVLKVFKLTEVDDAVINQNFEIGDEISDEDFCVIKRIFEKFLEAEIIEDGSWLGWDK